MRSTILKLLKQVVLFQSTILSLRWVTLLTTFLKIVHTNQCSIIKKVLTETLECLTVSWIIGMYFFSNIFSKKIIFSPIELSQAIKEYKYYVFHISSSTKTETCIISTDTSLQIYKINFMNVSMNKMLKRQTFSRDCQAFCEDFASIRMKKPFLLNGGYIETNTSTISRINETVKF